MGAIRSCDRGPPCPGFRTLAVLCRMLGASRPDSDTAGRGATRHLAPGVCVAGRAPASSLLAAPLAQRSSADQRPTLVYGIRCMCGPVSRVSHAPVPKAHAEPLTTLPLFGPVSRMPPPRHARKRVRQADPGRVRRHCGCRFATRSTALPGGHFALPCRWQGTTGNRGRPPGRHAHPRPRL
jgi:hypothetical protein